MQLPSSIYEFRIFCRKVVAYTAIASLTITPAASFSIPQGGIVSAGDASITSSGNTLTITQTTPKAVIDWQQFNVGEGEGTVFKQPDSGIALNRIHDINPSQIQGTLTANGKIMLINPNGMVFGKNSKVDVGGMLATTSNIGNDDFLAGNYKFKNTGNPMARIVNKGRITAKDGGNISLVAPGVDNSGVINARLGKVNLGGADSYTVDIDGDGLVQYDVTHSLTDQFVNNSGAINAEGGVVTLSTAAADTVIDSAINISGVVDVSKADGEAGVVIAHAGTHSAQGKGGYVFNSGSIKASGDKGGAVHMLGDKVALQSGAAIDASGKSGGGEVLVGGDYLGGEYYSKTDASRENAGGNSAVQSGKYSKLLETYYKDRGGIQKARKVYMDKNASVDVSAKDKGNGGRTIVWSDENTNFKGNIKASGGKNGGNGGFVETSSKEVLTAIGKVDASALKGNAGTWLLDPNNITIIAGADGADVRITETVGVSDQFDSNADNAFVTNGSIEAALNNGTSVVIETTTSGANTENGDITISSDITKSAGGNASLRFKAANSVILDSHQIISNAGQLDIIFHGDKDSSGAGAVYLNSGSLVRTNGGGVVIGGGINPVLQAARGTALGARNIGVNIDNSTIDAQGGNISIRGQARNAIGTDLLLGVGITAGSVVKTSGSGSVLINGTGGNGKDFGIGVALYGGAPSRVETENGLITITGNGGSTVVSTNSVGVAVLDGGVVEQTGTNAIPGDVQITGTGGSNGTSSNYGVTVFGAGSKVRSNSGNISITGNAGGTTTADYGVFIASAGAIESTGNNSDAANITITGTAAGSSGSNHGVLLDGVGTKISAVNGGIDVTGTGSAGNTNNIGVFLQNSAIIEQTGTSAVTGNINLRGTGGAGTTNNYGIGLISSSKITSSSGDISLIGDSNGTTNFNMGVAVDSAIIESIGNTIDAAKITLNGTSANAAASNIGVFINTNAIIRSLMGDISVTALGRGTGAGNIGFALLAGSTLLSTGAANISLNGTGGGTGASNANVGVYIDNSTINQQTGNINITAQGGNIGGSGFDNTGMYTNVATLSTAGGNIDITSTAGTNSGNTNHGIATSNTTFSTTGNGNITMRGNGRGTGNQEMGIYLNSTSNVNAVNGNISLTGNASTTAAGGTNYGVYLNNTSGVTSSGTGTISITGAGGGGATDTVGSNHGVYVVNSSTIRNTSAQVNGATQGTITINGTGGSNGGSGDTNLGVWVRSSGVISSVDGDINITGNGGAGSGIYNDGFALDSSARITGSNNANVTISGTGHGTGAMSYGLYFNSGSPLSTVNGNINLTGVGTTAGLANDNWGIIVDNGSITSSGLGNIAMTGTGGGAMASVGTGSYGVYMRNAGQISATGGTTSITGYDGKGTAGTNNAFATDGTANVIGGNTTTGNITLAQNDWSIGSLSVKTSGGLTISNGTSGSTIGVGTGAGALSVTNAILGMMNTGTASSVTIGSSTAGAMDINSNFAFSKPLTFRTGGGATPDITVNGQITNSSAGIATTLASGRNFTNNVGAAMFNMTGGGNWRTYSTNPASDFTNGLVSNYHRYSCTYGGTCPALGVGNGALYSYTPMLNVTPNSLSLTYGDAAALTPYAYTISPAGYLVGDAAIDVIGGSINASSFYSVGAAAGTYNINYNNGALTSALGYGFNYLNNPTGIVVTGGIGVSGGWAGAPIPTTPYVFPEPVTETPIIPVPLDPTPVVMEPFPSVPVTGSADMFYDAKELLEVAKSNIEIKNTYNAIVSETLKKYTPRSYLWDLFVFTKEAAQIFSIPGGVNSMPQGAVFY